MLYMDAPCSRLSIYPTVIRMNTPPPLAGVSFSVHAGECVCVTGHSGCGKSTLLLAIKGLLHDGSLTGDMQIDLPGGPGSLPPGRDRHCLPQNAETQILCATVARRWPSDRKTSAFPPKRSAAASHAPWRRCN